MRALIVVDVQNDFCPGGALAVPKGHEVIEPINEILKKGYRAVVFTQDWHPADHLSFAKNHRDAKEFTTVAMKYGAQTLWPEHCVQGSYGARIVSSLNVECADLILRKGTNRRIDSYSAFYENDGVTTTGLAGYLKDLQIEEVDCCGLARDICVLYTAKNAADLGYKSRILMEASRPLEAAQDIVARFNDTCHKAGIELV